MRPLNRMRRLLKLKPPSMPAPPPFSAMNYARLPITLAGRFSPLGPVGMAYFLPWRLSITSAIVPSTTTS